MEDGLAPSALQVAFLCEANVPYKDSTVIRAMMSLDLKNASTAQRKEFDASLDEQGWLKLSGVDTVWCNRFSRLLNNEDGIKEVRNTILRVVKKAAASGRIEQVKYVAQISNDDAIGRIVWKKAGEYVHRHYDPYAVEVE
ncbi:hypothetical protein [Pseudomonas sp. URIL14HWK12:I6]|uniref:hypothetical protein n=1 Tax=Pseudomonas sp. URIL14HWK12:I6 TaxID=1283293 RepID=UPI0012DC148F|nr:hypothetical protein [Pseudomonas sp. URIL14HWK12:I6]